MVCLNIAVNTLTLSMHVVSDDQLYNYNAIRATYADISASFINFLSCYISAYHIPVLVRDLSMIRRKNKVDTESDARSSVTSIESAPAANDKVVPNSTGAEMLEVSPLQRGFLIGDLYEKRKVPNEIQVQYHMAWTFTAKVTDCLMFILSGSAVLIIIFTTITKLYIHYPMK